MIYFFSHQEEEENQTHSYSVASQWIVYHIVQDGFTKCMHLLTYCVGFCIFVIYELITKDICITPHLPEISLLTF